MSSLEQMRDNISYMKDFQPLSEKEQQELKRQWPAAWFNNDGNVLYTMPNDFAGNSVNVTIIADTGTYGNGSMMVNGVSHTFVAGETYTWTVPVCANGTILFACIPTDPYSVDVSKI